jgi:hypothetical protein
VLWVTRVMGYFEWPIVSSGSGHALAAAAPTSWAVWPTAPHERRLQQQGGITYNRGHPRSAAMGVVKFFPAAAAA